MARLSLPLARPSLLGPAGRLLGAALLPLLLLITPVAARGADSQIMPLAEKSLLLDGQVVGQRIVVVGERGHILTSDDAGRSWQQRPAPTRATLTSVFFVDGENGWAAGHDSIILQTGDGGKSWRQVYANPDDERPILDLWFRDRDFGYAVGAYGLFLVTRDGGASWEEFDFAPEGEDSADAPADAEVPEGIDFHLNQVAAAGEKRLLVAAEAGNLYRSDDGGDSWVSLPSPYEGSFYGTLPLDRDNILAYGLRGHLFRTADGGDSWQELDSGTQATLDDAIRLADGRIAVVGLAGTLLLSSDGGQSFASRPLANREGLARVLQAGDGALVLVGEYGVRRIELPTAGKEAAQ